MQFTSFSGLLCVFPASELTDASYHKPPPVANADRPSGY
jgi:hypothetical protein